MNRMKIGMLATMGMMVNTMAAVEERNYMEIEEGKMRTANKPKICNSEETFNLNIKKGLKCYQVRIENHLYGGVYIMYSINEKNLTKKCLKLYNTKPSSIIEILKFSDLKM